MMTFTAGASSEIKATLREDSEAQSFHGHNHSVQILCSQSQVNASWGNRAERMD